MNLCFDKELLKILTAEEIIYISILINVKHYSESFHAAEFYGSDIYIKLFNFYSTEMPYGTAKARTGMPDVWILNKLRERDKQGERE